MSFNISLQENELAEYLSSQINCFFPSKKSVSVKDILDVQNQALQRVEYCFSKIKIKYFCDRKNTIFNHLNSDQYSMFLYFLCNTTYKKFGNLELASKFYLLNKSLHGIDVFYEVDLPDVFVFIHPIGTVLGRASYKDFFVVYQRCGVGSNKGSQPNLGEYLTLHPGASVLGNSNVGNNCSVASDSLVIDQNIEDKKTYIGNPKKHYLITRNNINAIWKS
jgi:serine O-acetyltransferase